MGAFNRLHASVPCGGCGVASDRTIQFKFGDVWQHEYEIGDTLRWGGNAQGEPRLTSVVVVGPVEEDCPHCGVGDAEVGVQIACDVITAVVAAPAVDDLERGYDFRVVKR